MASYDDNTRDMTTATRTGGAAGNMRWGAGDDAPTMASVGGVVVGDDDDAETSAATGDGETVAAETQVAPQEVMEELRRNMARRSKGRKAGAVFTLLIFAAGLVGLWFVTRPDNETDRMIFPLDESGRPDSASYVLRDENGRALVEVDYPRNMNASITEAPAPGGISVSSWMGRDRDVPFNLMLEARQSPGELQIDLLASVRSWIASASASGEGYVFDDRLSESLEQRFFEDKYPGSCQALTLYGVRFVQFEYKRAAPGGEVWHGVAIYFRRGDTVYLHRREIPDRFWVRGGYRILNDPNLAVYANFSDNYWESPGADAMPQDRSKTDLLAEVRAALERSRASDWRFVKGDLDALLAASWRGDSRTREAAESCLRQFRENLRVFYWQKYNAYMNAKDNQDERRMYRFRKDAEMVFDNKDERYYFLIASGEVW
ncbi:MAG: hypothetical protein J6U17_02395 [Kiritimatiellae bacterium]|nr:hypothetical protein [Kiritimatiellia bacterium]